MALLYQETFEGASVWPGLHLQFATSWAFNVSTERAYKGTKSGRFELRDTDPPPTSSGTRAEVLFPVQASLNRWYSEAIYFPSAQYLYDNDNDIINQWHQGISPSLSLRTEDGRFHVKVGDNKDTRVDIDLGPILYDQWNLFVFHIIHGVGSAGVLDVWHNGIHKIVNRVGGNMYPISGSIESPRWKVGIYKDGWNDSRTTDTSLRVLFFDEVTIGNESSNYDEMTGIPPIVPPPPPETYVPWSSTPAGKLKKGRIIDGN
jgi:hypothetical protein